MKQGQQTQDQSEISMETRSVLKQTTGQPTTSRGKSTCHRLNPIHGKVKNLTQTERQPPKRGKSAEQKAPEEGKQLNRAIQLPDDWFGMDGSREYTSENQPTLVLGNPARTQSTIIISSSNINITQRHEISPKNLSCYRKIALVTRLLSKPEN